MTTQEYFEKRALHKEYRMKNMSESFLKDLEKQYTRASKDIELQLEKFIKRYVEETDGSILDLKKAMTSKEVQEYYEWVNSYLSKNVLDDKLKKELQKVYLKGQISRQTSLKNQVELMLRLLGKSSDIATFEHLKQVYSEVYYQTAHELYEANRIEDLALFKEISKLTLDIKAIEHSVRNPWSSKSFSQRIWKNNRKLIRSVKETLTTGLAQGQSIEKMSRSLSHKMKSGMSDARRLIRTETNYVLGESTFETYKNAELEKYKFLATLDSKTSEICQELDSKVFLVKDKEVGLNCNPMHPNCRSTTVAYFEEYEEENANGTRIARGSDGKNYYVNRNMNYKQWFENLPEKESVNMKMLQKMNKNKSYDKKQYQSYKEQLFNKAPSSFGKFQNMKYNDPQGYKEIKNLYNSVNRGYYWNTAEFSTQKSFVTHYNKHREEFGSISQQQYLSEARKVLSKRINGEDSLGFRTSTGFLVKYDVNTNTFAVGRKDLKISTVYRPKDGVRYYNEQYEINKKKGDIND